MQSTWPRRSSGRRSVLFGAGHAPFPGPGALLAVVVGLGFGGVYLLSGKTSWCRWWHTSSTTPLRWWHRTWRSPRYKWQANCPLCNCTSQDTDQDSGFLYVARGSRAVFNAPSTFKGLRKIDGIGGGAIANRGELRMNRPTVIDTLSLGGSGESNSGWGVGLWTAQTGKTVFKGATNCQSTDDEGNIGGGLMNQGTMIFATQNPVAFSYNNAYGGGGTYNAEGVVLRFAGPANITDNIGGDDGNGAAIENFGLIAFGKMAPAVFQGGFVRSNVGAGIHSQKGTIR